jgi:probable rRNA maturation factor
MINVIINSDSRYKVNRQAVRGAVVATLQKQKVSGKVEVGINIVGDRKMRRLNRDFRGINESCIVLSFPLENGVRGAFVNPPDKILRLGDIVISYPVALRRAAQENRLVEEEIKMLVEHGVKHLLGIGE